MLLFFFDILSAAASILITYNLVTEGITGVVKNIHLEMIVFTLLVVGTFAYLDLYNYLVFLNRFRYIYRTVKGIGYIFIFYLIWLWISYSLPSRNVFGILMLFFVFSSMTYFSKTIIIPLFSLFLPRREVVLFAPEGNYKKISDWLKNHTVSGVKIKKISENKKEIEKHVENGLPVIVSTFTEEWETLIETLFSFKGRVTVLLFSSLLAGIKGIDYWGYLDDIPIVYFRWSGHSKIYNIVKKIVDIIGAIFAIIVFSPFMIIAAAGTKLTSRGPVFFIQNRVGKGGKIFKMLKFRSMVEPSDDKPHKEFVKDCINGNSDNNFKFMTDGRITPWGKFLRKTSIDEFPQFLNILKGGLSLVGPRPPLDYEVDQYSNWHKKRLSVAQGITGVWQIFGRARLPFAKSCFLDIYYAENRSLCLDLHLLTQTPQAIIFAKGAY